MKYQVYGIIVDSDLPLFGVSIPYVGENRVLIRCTDSSVTFQIPSQWFMQWHLPQGELWLSLGKMDGGYFLRFNELADFFVSGDGQKVFYKPDREIASNTLRHLLLDQVIPLIINLKGGEALHASAVLAHGGTIAFIGVTGAGKSTIAGSFLSAGYSLLSDDCLTIVEKKQNITATPAYPGLRLWKDSAAYLFGEGDAYETVAHYTNKHQVDIESKTESFYTEHYPLKRIYAIDDSTETRTKMDIKIEPFSPRDSLMVLVRSVFRLDITDRDMLTRQFHFLERVASCVSVRRLIFPRDFNILPAVREAILNDLKDLDN